MNRIVRLLTVWLVMLTLPLQGVSASMMAVRMAADDAQAPAVMATMTQDAPMVDCHGGVDKQAQTRHSDHGHNLPAKGKLCGNCCVGVLLGALAAPELAGPLGNGTYAIQIYQEPLGHVPDGLERPPRFIS